MSRATGIAPNAARQMAESVVPRGAIAKNALGAWSVTLTDVELAKLLSGAVATAPSPAWKELHESEIQQILDRYAGSAASEYGGAFWDVVEKVGEALRAKNAPAATHQEEILPQSRQTQ